LDEQFQTLEDYLAILKRRKWQLILPIVLLAPIAVIVALTLPPIYRSTATILIEQQEIPPDLIRTTVTSFADQRIQVIKQRVMTTKNPHRYP
jgi:polysaccharide biosynthesis transport protein